MLMSVGVTPLFDVLGNSVLRFSPWIQLVKDFPSLSSTVGDLLKCYCAPGLDFRLKTFSLWSVCVKVLQKTRSQY